jgi:hypothetical protein
MRIQSLLAGAWIIPAVASHGAEPLTVPPAADTSLFSAFAGNNFGTSTLVVGGNAKKQPGRTLLRFDLPSEISAGATITRAVLGFSVTREPSGAVASTFHAHRMLKGWQEGRGTGNTGSAALSGESTWANQVHPDVPWSAAGGASGTDYLATSSASVLVEGDGPFELEGAALAADVQAWLADPAQNFGWILISDLQETALTARRLGSREDPANAATLTLEFSAAAPRPVIHRFGRTADRIEFEFEAQAGNAYEVQFAEDPATNSVWTMLTNYTAKLETTNVVVSDLLNAAPRRYYRVADVGDVD